MLTLHYVPGTCAFVPHVALEWSGLPYEGKAESKASIKEPSYLNMNPMGQVPLLVDGDWTLTQNVAIVSYIHELAPEAGIFGKGCKRSAAKAKQWLAFANADLHRQFSLIFGAVRYIDGEDCQQKLAAKARETIAKLYGIIDDALDGQDYLAGDLSIADIYVYITTRWAQSLNIDLSAFHRLAEYCKRVESNDGVQKVLKTHGLA
ncbi:MAG: glutathione S-transferase family protein [Cardiobacteriaceae bacterium]|nr:glutathione S-transferase family protein [Cardiobacteriaceae bacterium]